MRPDEVEVEFDFFLWISFHCYIFMNMFHTHIFFNIQIFLPLFPLIHLYVPYIYEVSRMKSLVTLFTLTLFYYLLLIFLSLPRRVMLRMF